MSDAIILPPGVAFAVIAFLLSLLPAGLFLWLAYLRRHDRPVPVKLVLYAFVAGGIAVWPAFALEGFGKQAWELLAPSSSYYFDGAILPLQTPWDVFFPALATFLIVALVEEGLRFGILWPWIRRSRNIDQVFDGLVVGVAAGLGFATLENTVYFWNLFTQGSFDTLVFVFFLRFLISTLAHLSFGGIMGAFIAQGVFHVYNPARFYFQAFLLPWFVHGLFDLLLGINQSFYAVLLLLPLISTILFWATKREFYTIQRKDGHLLLVEEAPQTKQTRALRLFWSKFDSPWNVTAPWMRERRVYRTLLHNMDDDEA